MLAEFSLPGLVGRVCVCVCHVCVCVYLSGEYTFCGRIRITIRSIEFSEMLSGQLHAKVASAQNEATRTRRLLYVWL